MGIVIASDFHCKYQKVVWMDTATGEVGEANIDHVEVSRVREFFSRFAAGSVLGMEASGYSYWFEELVLELGLDLRIGHSQEIAAKKARRQKNDRRDAWHMLDLLLDGKFPTIWRPDADNRSQRALIRQRCRLVTMRTRLINAVRALAYNYNVVIKRGDLTRAKKQRIAAIRTNPRIGEQRDEMLEMIEQLDRRIKQKDQQIEQLVANNQAAARLCTVKGVGPCTALATVLFLGPAERFRNGKAVVGYVGLDCCEDSTNNRYQQRRYGHISKQGNKLLRWLLGQCATVAACHNDRWKRQYSRMCHRKDWRVAKTAVARKLLVCLYVMLRDGIDYSEFLRRGSGIGMPVRTPGRK